jgi:hypothetical protein
MAAFSWRRPSAGIAEHRSPRRPEAGRSTRLFLPQAARAVQFTLFAPAKSLKSLKPEYFHKFRISIAR